MWSRVHFRHLPTIRSASEARRAQRERPRGKAQAKYHSMGLDSHMLPRSLCSVGGGHACTPNKMERNKSVHGERPGAQVAGAK